MEKSKDDIWHSITSQKLPRGLFVDRWKNGCPTPKCGKKLYKTGYYPWLFDPVNYPWKLQCPVCKERYPKNDFWKYYKSGLNKKAEFDPQLADKSLLYNTEHPSQVDPLRNYGVDNGYGYNDKDGHSFKFGRIIIVNKKCK